MTTSEDEYKEVRRGYESPPCKSLLGIIECSRLATESVELSIQYQKVLGRLKFQKEDTSMSICCCHEGDIFGLQC